MITKTDAIRLVLCILEPNLKYDRNEVKATLKNGSSVKLLLRTALNNRLLFAFSSALLNEHFSVVKTNPSLAIRLSRICNKGEKWIIRFRKTLGLLNIILEKTGICALVIKTFRYPQDVTFDIDILLKNVDDFQKIKPLLKERFNIKKVKGGYEASPKTRKFLVIDIYYDFIKFGNKRLLNPSFLWSKVQHLRLEGNEYTVPNPEGEIILHLSQILFQNRFLTLSDFMHLIKVISNQERTISWKNIVKEASMYGWNIELIRLISIIHGLYLRVWKNTLDIPILPDQSVKLILPHFLSPNSLLKLRTKWQGLRGLKPFLLQDCWAYATALIKYHVRNKIPIYRDWIDIETENY